MVEVKASNVFFGKRYSLVYGKFLRKLLDTNNEITTICYKIPSFIHKVNYDQVVNELWETDITKEDKKNIGNITFGMLGKSHNTAQKSYCFNSLREACHYQREFGGRIYAIQQETEEVKDDEEKRYMGNTYYILNTTNRSKLVNRFRYIKEMLLQYHNFSMYEAYNTLIES